MSECKLVTEAGLLAALDDATSATDVNTTGASYNRMVFDALPTPPLDADVLAAIRELADDCCMVRCNGCEGPCGPLATGTITTALLAGVAANAQLRAAVTVWDATLSDYCDGPERDAVRAVLAATPPSALAERYRALEAMEARAKAYEDQPVGSYILHGEATDA